LGLFSWNAVFWAFAAVGAVAGLRSRHRAYWAFLIATIGYVIIVSTGDAAGARYRVPVIPMLALLAAQGIQYSLRRVRNSRRQPDPPDDRPLVTASGVAG
jgi:CHASE2 domain-containing sensor protein